MPILPAGIRPVRNYGFTLVELLVVLAILGGIIGLVLPRLQPRAASLDQQAVLVADLLRDARRRAILDGVVTELAANDIDAGPFDLTDRNGDSAKLVFYPMGNSSGGSWSLKSSEREVQIDIDWLTGMPLIGQRP